MGDSYTPDYWQKRALETRAVADSFKDEGAKATMRQVAESYEKMARTTRLLQSGLASGKHVRPFPSTGAAQKIRE